MHPGIKLYQCSGTAVHGVAYVGSYILLCSLVFIYQPELFPEHTAPSVAINCCIFQYLVLMSRTLISHMQTSLQHSWEQPKDPLPEAGSLCKMSFGIWTSSIFNRSLKDRLIISLYAFFFSCEGKIIFFLFSWFKRKRTKLNLFLSN